MCHREFALCNAIGIALIVLVLIALTKWYLTYRQQTRHQHRLQDLDRIFAFSDVGVAIISQKWRCRKVNPYLCHQLPYLMCQFSKL